MTLPPCTCDPRYARTHLGEYPPEDPCGHGDVSEGCPRHDPDYEDWRDDQRYDDEDRVPGDGDLFGETTEEEEALRQDKLRTMVITYGATDEDAETFMVVLGSVAENFRGVELHEFVDETILEDAGDDRGAIDALYARMTAEGRLSREQREQLERFSEELREWAGGET